MTLWRPPGQFRYMCVAGEIVRETLDYLASTTATENIAYWAGDVEGEDFRVRRVIRPQAIREPAFVMVHALEVARIVEECSQLGDFLVAQLHTHPGYEDHSELDDCGSVSRRNGFVSLVVPCYARLATLTKPGWFGYELQSAEWGDFDVRRIKLT